ncbi:ATP-dependent helicase [Humisphaera borealis]|uniref:DNA 3'-5' helicase n=1 Tax=Humisphaera borealis TaxID=2807512 RepID=A0A7M2X2J0_9BACT|nr:UvrD-helicase domain-containing protein [Humisphaera borealis]QOV91986.1 UvrD-helicase domain-containing protein [Humisphaera borealis]
MIDPKSLLDDLTEPQRAAATHVDGPLLIIAGAGSGKTRVITRRVAYLVSQGIPAWSILAITFTNKAAGEMKERIGHVLGRQVRDFGRLDQPWPTVCTFHSLCLRILRHYSQQVGLGATFSIYDSSDQTKLIKEALKALDISSDNFSPATVHNAIGDAKNKLITPEQFAEGARDFFHKTVARVYTKYQALLKQNNALDFDDLLMRTVQAFRDVPNLLPELQDRYQYILIDEYQDTNHAQYLLAHALAMKHRNMCVVGDPDQSIYAWRGADLRNILEFERDYPDAEVVRLEQNYRSTKTILAIASQLIANNTHRKKKDLWTENADGDKAEVTFCQDEHDEAEVVMRRLTEFHAAGVPWGDMAIFYRMNSLSRVMEESLFRNKVPYVIARGTEFYNRKEIKDVLAYLRLIANPNDEVSLSRVVNVPTRGLGDASLKQIAAWGIGNQRTLFESLAVAAKIPGVSSRAGNAAVKFVELVKKWRELAGIRVGGTSDGTPLAPSSGTPGEGWGGGSVDAANSAEISNADSEDSQGNADGSNPHSNPPPEYLKRGPEAGGEIRVSDQASLFGDESEWDAAPLDEEESIADEPFAPSDEPFAPPDEPTVATEDSALSIPPSVIPPMPIGGVRNLMEEVVRSSGMEAHLRKTGDADLSELKNVEELITAAAEFDKEQPEGTLIDYLAQVSLVADVDHMGDGGGSVTLMTLHAAKGLEFPVVAIIGLEEGILPHSRSRDDIDQKEEERRLFFVGITRARQRLLITKAQVRTVRGLRERTIPSPFLRELPEDYLKVTDRAGLDDIDARGGYGGSASRDDHNAGKLGFKRGQMVRHPTFGLGRIDEMTDTGSGTRAVIQFNAAGRKTLILEYARLEKVG